SATPKIMRRKPNKYGYIAVTLRRDNDGKMVTVYVHTLVLLAFLGPPPDGMECRHFPDNTRTNNRLTNLNWSTHQQNIADRAVHGTNPSGDKNPSRLYPEKRPRGERH